MRTTNLLLLASLLALAACPARPRIPTLGPALARCPAELTDAVVNDPRVYLSCPLPEPVARLVRSDYADDELAAPDWESLRRFDGRVPREAFAWQLEQFVVPDQSLSPWIELDRTSGVLRPDPILAPDLQLALPSAPLAVPPLPARLQLPLDPAPFHSERQVLLRTSRDPSHPVGTLRVLLDPGHCGGDLATLEARDLHYTNPEGHAFVIREGELTLRTALELKAKLEAQGIEVALTRDAPGPGHPFPFASYRPYADQLLRHLSQDPAFKELDARLAPDDRRRLRAAVALYALKKEFVFDTLRYRMAHVADAPPDLMISIHYNASAGAPGRSYGQALVAMIKGHAEAHRLYNPYYRFRAVHDALSVDEFNASAHLGAGCMRQMSQALSIPIGRVNRYPDHKQILRIDGVPSGVDAWNGVLFRYVDFPAVLTEGPHMDEKDEMPRLEATLAAPLFTPGTRSDQYAEGLSRGIVEWATRWLAQEKNDFGPDL